MAPQKFGPIATLNPAAWQLEAASLAKRADARAARRRDRRAPKR